MLKKPFTDLNGYVAYFRSVEFPVLRKTARDLEHMREDEDKLSARQIAGVVLDDPLMALKLLIFQHRRRGSSQNHDITTIERAVMMIGMTPFFERFGELQTVEELLADQPRALIGMLKVISRAKRASRYARDWALLRHDIDVDEITLAALLHEAAEILLWCFAPELVQQAYAMQKNSPGLRSSVAQRATLGVSVTDLQFALVREYDLPQLLISLMDAGNADNPRVRTVTLACDLARHAANGWDDPALPDDFRAVAELLHTDIAHVVDRIGVPPESSLASTLLSDPDTPPDDTPG